ncbi:Retrovirus-related Pol polyprotein from transposon 297 family [Gossypium australe]|uniref:Retrovirus-related Pol polyprotein from transposon 297 family n=1 Tax=Gossypium australe TaxID=47621 RepID=A0A5B6X0K8_9ROSI|nr:Retrovirus-related Pol polyprotein from transposon 297 family [Gossypium australe]
MMGNVHINTIHEGTTEGGTLSDVRPYELGSVLNNWIAEEIPIVFRAYIESRDINDMSNAAREFELSFEQDMCLEGSQDLKDDIDCDLSLDLLRMVKQEEKQILPHEETVEVVTLEEGKVVKIGTCIIEETKRDLINLLQEFKNVFAWSYQDMLGLSIDIVVHRLPIKEDCRPVQQKLRRMRPDIVLKIKEEVNKQFDAGFLQEVKYSEWVANIVPVPKKDGKVMPFELKNVGATYQRAMVTLFHDMMYKEIEVYVDDMIAKSQTEIEHIQVLRKLFLRLRKFQLKLNPTKCTFGARSGKLLGFIVSEKGIEIDSDKKHNLGVWDNECQKAFDKVKQYLSSPPVLSPPCPDRPLIMYLTVFDHSIRMTRWQFLLSEFDIVYVSQKAVKRSAVADFLASRALEEYEPLTFDFSNEELMYVAATEEDAMKDHLWKLNFNRASNAIGNGIGAVLVSPNGDHYPFTCKLDFDCTNNMAEYEACIMGLRAAIERKIRVLEVYGDSTLVIYQLRGEWETRDPKLINYRRIVLGLIEEFDDIAFNYLPRDENQMADVLATLASIIKVSKQEDVKHIQMSIYEAPSHCYNVEEEERYDHPWYYDILRCVRNREYLNQTTENDKRTLRRLAYDYVLDGEILYKRRKDQVLLRCVDVVEVKKILEEVHEGVCGTHANGFTMARKIMRFGYYWSTMEGDCINYAKRCHKCQIYGGKIHVPLSPLHVITSPLPFSMWGMDAIGPISLKASNGHRFIFEFIDYFTKWVEAASYTSVTK